MSAIALFIAIPALLLWGGYQAGRRLPLPSALAAVLLLVGAGFIVHLDLGLPRVGDGVPTGAAASLFLLMLLEYTGIALAGTLLVAGWRGRHAALSKGLFFLIVLPFASYALYRSIAGPMRYHPETPGMVVQDDWKDGYRWALDNRILTTTDCKADSARFEVGCADGVRKNVERQSR